MLEVKFFRTPAMRQLGHYKLDNFRVCADEGRNTLSVELDMSIGGSRLRHRVLLMPMNGIYRRISGKCKDARQALPHARAATLSRCTLIAGGTPAVPAFTGSFRSWPAPRPTRSGAVSRRQEAGVRSQEVAVRSVFILATAS